VPDNILKYVIPVAMYLILPSIILADVLTLLFVGQIGWPIGRPSLQKGMAGFFLTLILIPAAVLIGDLFFKFRPDLREQVLTGKVDLAGTLPALFTGDDDALATNAIIWTVAVVVGLMLIVLRYAGVVGSAKRAVRRYMDGEV
jgi:hypothetical protein